MKSTKEKSLTFWREDFENKDKKQSFMIRKSQILGLKKWSNFNNCICGFVINFRSLNNKTFFIMINNFIQYTSTITKKSINYNDILKMNPIEIESKIIRTDYFYDIEKFLSDTRLR